MLQEDGNGMLSDANESQSKQNNRNSYTQAILLNVSSINNNNNYVDLWSIVNVSNNTYFLQP